MPRRKRRIKKAGRSPLRNTLVNVPPSKAQRCFLLAFAHAPNAARVAPCLLRRFCCALELLDGVSVIVDKCNSTLVVWESWNFRSSLVCDLLFHIDPSTVIWGIRAVVVDAIESTSHTRGIIIIASGKRPSFERWETVFPFVANCNSTTSIARVVRRVLVKASLLHAAPHAVKTVTTCWNIGIQPIDALFHGFCDCFWPSAFATRKCPAGGQTFARYASYCSAFASAYPSNLVATFVKTEYRPLANSLPRKVFCPLTSLLMKHCVAEHTSARLLSSTSYVLYRCINSVPASAFELPNRSVATVATDWANRGKPAKRLPRVILDKSASCWVLDFCHRALLGGCCA